VLERIIGKHFEHIRLRPNCSILFTLLGVYSWGKHTNLSSFAVTFEKPNIQTGLSTLIGLLSSCLRPKWHQTSDLMSFLGSNSGKVTLLMETVLLLDVSRHVFIALSGFLSGLNLTASLIANTIVIIFQFIIIFWLTVSLYYRQVAELASTVVCLTAIYIFRYGYITIIIDYVNNIVFTLKNLVSILTCSYITLLPYYLALPIKVGLPIHVHIF